MVRCDEGNSLSFCVWRINKKMLYCLRTATRSEIVAFVARPAELVALLTTSYSVVAGCQTAASCLRKPFCRDPETAQFIFLIFIAGAHTRANSLLLSIFSSSSQATAALESRRPSSGTCGS